MVTGGLILSFILRTGYKDLETGDRYEKDFYFQQSMHTQIMSALVSKPEPLNLQLFEYVPYRYEPCSKIYEYKVERVMNLIK